VTYEERERAIRELRDLDFRLRHLPPDSPSRPRLEEEREAIVGALAPGGLERDRAAALRQDHGLDGAVVVGRPEALDAFHP
jgi:hypothetical protein